ncbi:cytochrome c oxidase subunit II [Prosthecobacter sp.]|uniref:cytochrome c oxidase subunit II n=1 Tax=Prosthecobacter sp. TaxID=1965333 RepID=UPI0037830D78
MKDFLQLFRSASNFGGPVDALLWALLLTCGLMTLILGALILLFCWRYRRGSPASRAPLQLSQTKVEITWTLIPLLIFLGLFAWAAKVYFDMARPPADALEIHVVAKQWMWKMQHPNGCREINELHIPVGRPVSLVMISQDVIHSFYVPAFRTKQDVLPGRYTSEWFTPTRTGRFHLFCAEYCGTDHSAMTGSIVVMEPAQYSAWLASQPPPESVTAAGQRLFLALGCAGCHATGSRVPAPLLEGLYGRPVGLADGTTLIADEAYLRDSILLPNKHITGGYQPVMPTYQGQLGEEEVLQLITYLKSLSAPPPPTP